MHHDLNTLTTLMKEEKIIMSRVFDKNYKHVGYIMGRRTKAESSVLDGASVQRAISLIVPLVCESHISALMLTRLRTFLIVSEILTSSL